MPSKTAKTPTSLLSPSKTRHTEDITVAEEKEIIDSLLDCATRSDEDRLLQSRNISPATLKGIMRRNSSYLGEQFRAKCQLDVYKENRNISEIKDKAFSYLLDQVSAAISSENSLAYLDKITKMLDTVDKIDRLNRGEATENVHTTSQNTTTTVNVSDLVSQLATPEDKRAFLLKKMEDLRFNNKNSN
jgi:hypothetical protein